MHGLLPAEEAVDLGLDGRLGFVVVGIGRRGRPVMVADLVRELLDQ